MELNFMFIVYGIIIFALAMTSTENKDSALVMLVSIIICNIINFDYIKFNFSAHFIEVIFLEVAAIVVTVAIVKFIDWMMSISAGFISFILKLVASFGLCYIFYNIKAIINFMLTLI